MSGRAGLLGPPPPLRPLEAISPSQFSGLQACALSGVWAANRVHRPLPASPAARLGTIAHRLLEDAGRGLLDDPSPAGVERRWDELLAGANEAMANSWLDRHLVPLSESVADFEVRKLRATRLARELALSATRDLALAVGNHRSGHEMVVSTPDGRATGRIDAVVAGPDGLVIRDYKSGAIYQEYSANTSTLKEAYSTQLKLYAAVFAAMTGEWPVRLEVVPVAGEPEEVPFSPAEAEQLLLEAVRLLDAVNGVLATTEPRSQQELLARPSTHNCRFCPYRPWCAPYRRAADAAPDGWPADTWGEVTEVRSLGNSRILLTLEHDGLLARLAGLDPRPERHPALALLDVGDPVAAFDLRRQRGSSSLSEGTMTVIYRLETGA